MIIFAINPGSTSTKVALYNCCDEIWSESISYQQEELAKFNGLAEEEGLRYDDIVKLLQRHNVNLSDIDSIAGRGGLLHPLQGGAWIVNDAMLSDLRSNRYGTHASNLGAILALRLAKEAGGRPAYIVDPVCVDEMPPLAHISGVPDMPRKSVFHALNQRAVAYRAAAQLGRSVKDSSFVIAHMGGGISVGAHCNGRVVDVNNALGGYGPMSPDRAGTLSASDIIRKCFSGKYQETDMHKMVVGRAGLSAHLGTTDFREITARVVSGDAKAKLIVEALAYQVSCEIGSRAAALYGQVDAVILTGGLAHSEYLCNLIEERVSWIAKLMIIPGEDELKALAEGVYRVMSGEEDAHIYEQL